MKVSLSQVAAAATLVGIGALATWGILGARQEGREAEALAKLQTAYAGGIAEGLGVGQFHDTLRGEEPMLKLATSFAYPEPNDAQRLAERCNGVCKGYKTGPVALRVYAAASGNLSSFRDWVGVAGLSVAARNKLPDLGLDGGQVKGRITLHTLELRAGAQTPSDPKWEARIVSALTPSSPKSLNVEFVQSGGVPEAALFHWDGKQGSPRGQMIAVKCPGGVCFVGPDKLKPRWEGSDDRCTGVQQSHCAQWGFYDEQELAADDGNGNLEKSGSRGLIVPDPGLAAVTDSTEFERREVPVAFIRIWGADYQKGGVTIPKDTEVSVLIMKNRGGWFARFVANGADVARNVPVIRHDHGSADVLAAARWKWSPHDEGVWVRCGPGCCEIDLM